MPSTIFSGQKIKTLKDTLTLNGKSDIISSTVDPTASAVDAPIGSLLINQTSGKLYRKLDAGSSVNWEEVGAGVGGINYILNPSAEVNTTGWATYADAAGTAPVDGTGGSPNVTWTRSTTSPLRGVADFNFVKDAANRQGQGVSYDFTIDEADKAKVLSVTFDYEVLSGTYADGDLTVYLIADPTGTPVVIQPAGYTVSAATVGTTMREVATFQTQATGTSYRLCFHVASTSASAYTLAIDNVVVGPQQTVQGAAVSDWVSYTPTITTTSGTMTNFVATGFWKREGDNLKVSAQIRFTGAVGTWAGPEISIPSGLNIDFAKAIYNDGAGNLNIVSGMGRITRPGVSNYTLSGIAANVFGTNKFRLHNKFTVDAGSVAGVGEPLFDSSSAGISNLAPLSLTTNDIIWIQEVTLPIQGWSSNTVMSQDTDTRVVAAEVFLNSTQTGINTNNSYVKVNLNTVQADTHSGFSGGSYTIPVSGWYQFNGAAQIVGANVLADRYALSIWLGTVGSGTLLAAGDLRTATAAVTNGYSVVCGPVYLNAGDVISLGIYGVGNNSVNTYSIQSGRNATRLSIERLSGSATIAASEAVAMARAGSVVRSVPVTGAYLDFDNASGFTDTHGAWRAGSGYVAGTGAWSVQPAYVVPVSGIYSVAVRIILGSTAGFKQLYMHKNGSTFASTADDNTFAGNFPLSMHGQIRCNAGDLLQVFFAPQNAQNAPSTVSSFWTGIEISRVGN